VLLMRHGAGGTGAEVLTRHGAGGTGAEVLTRKLTALVTTKSANAPTADHFDIDPPKGNNGRSL
jgi:hypothetical protein